MRHLIFLSILVSLFACNFQTKENILTQRGLSLEVVERGSYKMTLSDTNYYFLIEARLVNSSDSIVEIDIMSCSANNSFIINSNLFKIKPNDCNKNSARLIELKPYQVLSVPLLLVSNINLIDKSCEIQLGFIHAIQPVNYYKSLSETINEFKISKKNIIWSQPFIIKSGASPILINN